MIDHRTIAEGIGAAVPVGLAVARHMPAPLESSKVYAWLFDVTQDLAKNNDRIGERRKATLDSNPIEHGQIIDVQKEEINK